MSGKTGRRLIPRDACSWCGHQPHNSACTRKIQTAAKPLTTAPCPCTRSAT